MSISVLLLANHSDLLLEKSLSSVAWADEVILGWTGEKDPTPEDKATLERIIPTIRVVRIPGEITDFSATRNHLHSKVKSDWVFWLDSDEVFCTESLSKLHATMNRSDINGVMIHRVDIFGGKALKWGEVQNVKILRMFRVSTGSFIRPVHEVAVVEGEITDPGIVIEHYAHSSISSFIAKVIRYAQIEAKLRYQKGKKSSPLEMIVWPTGKFFSNMFVHLAFLDGWQGVSYALVMSIHSLAVRACLIELWQDKKK